MAMKPAPQRLRFKSSCLSIFLLSLFTAGWSYAAFADAPKLETILVTANAQNTEEDNTQRISIETIRVHDKETVGAALNLTSGVSLSKVGARNEEMIYVRGFDLRQVPVFLDGIPVYVPYDGYVDLGRFNTFGIAHIDVAKGFSSLIYGPNTLGGAINLVSRKPGELWEGEIGVGTTWDDSGANNARRVYSNIGSNQGSWYIQAGLAYRDVDSFSLPDDFPARRFEAGGERENSYSDDRQYSVKVAFTPNETDEYSLSYSAQQGEKGNPPYAGAVASINARYWQWPMWDKDSLYLLTHTQWDRLTLKVRAYYDTYKNSLFTYDDATYTTQNRPSSFKSWYDDIGKTRLRDSGHYFTATEMAGFGFAVNTHALRKLGIAIPKTWRDLTNPQLAGQIIVPNPARVGFAPVLIDIPLQGYGWDAGWALWSEITGNAELLEQGGWLHQR